MKTNPRTKPAFPLLRVAMLLFLLFNIFSPLGRNVSAQDDLASFQDPNGQLCHDLDTDDNLVLSEAEAGALAGDPYNYSKGQIAQVAKYCEGLPSMSADEIAADKPATDPVVNNERVAVQAEPGATGVCHATGSVTNQYRFISPDDQSYAMHLANHFGPGGGDRLATEAEFEAGRCFNDAVVSFVKYFCTVNAVEAPAPEIGEPGDNCVVATDQVFTLSIEGKTFTTDDLLSGVRLAPGTYNLYEGETLVGSITITETGTTLSFNVLNYVAEPMFEVVIEKYFCTVNELEAPAPEIGEPGDNCVLATDQEFTLSIDGQEFTTADLLAGVMLAPGTYDLYEGTTLVGTITVVDANQTVTVLNYVAEEVQPSEITILKRFCEGDNSEGNISNCNGREAPDVDVTFTVVGGDVNDTIVVDEFNQGNGSQGQASSDFDLVAGETYLVCEIEPEGWMGIARANGENQTPGDTENCVNVVVTPGNNVVQFNNFEIEVPEVPGVVTVIKYFCADESITAPVVGDEGDYDGCELATAEQLEGVNFLVYPFGVEADAIDIDDTALLTTGVELPVGTHTLVEVVDGVTYELGDIVVTADGTTTIIVFNPVVEEVETSRIHIIKRFCEADNSPNNASNCNGRVEFDGTVTFTVSDSEGAEVGTITITEFNQGNGSQGHTVGEATSDFPLAVGETYTVCEEDLAGFDEVGRVIGRAEAGETPNCLVITLNPGANTIQFHNYPVEVPAEEVTLNIYKFVCSGFSDKQEDGCVESNALDGTTIDFTVSYMIGEDETTVETSLEIQGSEGSAVLTLPVADSYTVCEMVPDGVEGVLFAVGGIEVVTSDDDSCITFSGEGLSDGDILNVSFWNDMVDKTPETPGKPAKPVTPEKPVVKPAPVAVTSLPNTGSGDTDNEANTSLYLLSGITMLAGLGAFIMKDRERRAA